MKRIKRRWPTTLQERLGLRAATAWDHAFFHVNEPPFWLRLLLKDGRTVIGYLGTGSCASSYPEPNRVHVEEPYEAAGEGGYERGARLDGGEGEIIVQEDYCTVEFLSDVRQLAE